MGILDQIARTGQEGPGMAQKMQGYLQMASGMREMQKSQELQGLLAQGATPQELLKNGFLAEATAVQGMQPTQRKAPSGYEWNGDSLTFIPGGPADPAVIKKEANLKRAPLKMVQLESEIRDRLDNDDIEGARRASSKLAAETGTSVPEMFKAQLHRRILNNQNVVNAGQVALKVYSGDVGAISSIKAGARGIVNQLMGVVENPRILRNMAISLEDPGADESIAANIMLVTELARSYSGRDSGLTQTNLDTARKNLGLDASFTGNPVAVGKRLAIIMADSQKKIGQFGKELQIEIPEDLKRGNKQKEDEISDFSNLWN